MEDYSNVNGIIFDFDGPLIPSTQVGFKNMQRAAVASCVTVPSFRQIRQFWGEEFMVMIHKLGQLLGWPKQRWAEVGIQYNWLSERVCYERQPLLLEALSELAEQGYRLGILSNRDKRSLNSLMEQQGFNVLPFSLIAALGGPGVKIKKPNPSVFQPFWQDGFTPNQTVFVGDSINFDLAAAKRHQPELAFVGIESILDSSAAFQVAGVPERNIFSGVPEMVANQDRILSGWLIN